MTLRNTQNVRAKGAEEDLEGEEEVRALDPGGVPPPDSFFKCVSAPGHHEHCAQMSARWYEIWGVEGVLHHPPPPFKRRPGLASCRMTPEHQLFGGECAPCATAAVVVSHPRKSAEGLRHCAPGNRWSRATDPEVRPPLLLLLRSGPCRPPPPYPQCPEALM